VAKEPNAFKNGYWDIDLKYVFEYWLTFREADGCAIGSVKANSIFNARVTLFGSIDSDSVIATDLVKSAGGNTLEADPFVLTEAKAVNLAAELRPCGRPQKHADEHHGDPREVLVTIGLFTIVKLFRIVNLLVESKGFCIPEECAEHLPLNPCEFFETLDFPMDIFAPPQKPEFFAGINQNISPKRGGCGCDETEARSSEAL